MRELQDIVAEIILELSRIHKLPQPYKDEDDAVLLPRQLGLGNGQFIPISKKIDQFIADVALALHSSSSLQHRFAADDYRGFVRHAFGPALAEIDLDADPSPNSRSVLAAVQAKVADDVDWILNNGGQEYAFGCTLFTYNDFEPFNIGPVCFEPREVWLERKTSDGRSARIGPGGRIERFNHQIAAGAISVIAKRRISRVWQGQKSRARKRSVDSDDEENVVEAIGDCPYVCSVEIPGFGGKAGQDKALLAARLALTAISLIWGNPSKALNGLNLLFDREMRGQSLLSFTSDGLILGGRMKSNMPHAPWVKRDELNQHFQEFSGEFAVAGEAIGWLLNPLGNHTRPELLNIFAQALLWFHDGCREITDLKAIVSFASCIEILAGGDGRKSILKLIDARLGFGKNVRIHRNGSTVEEVIDQIYDEGRTRFVHGPRRKGRHVWGNKLGYDWSEIRGLAESLARECLVCCLGWAAENPQGDDPSLLLK